MPEEMQTERQVAQHTGPSSNGAVTKEQEGNKLFSLIF